MSWLACAWMGGGLVSCWKVVLVLARRMVFRVSAASSESRVLKEWQGWPLALRLVVVLRLASAGRVALATGSGAGVGCSSSKSSGLRAWRRCQAS